jgi:hypothetical protein
MSIKIKETVMRHLIERREFINIERISGYCGYSNSMLHRAIYRFKDGGGTGRVTANFYKLFVVAVFLGMTIDGVTATVHLKTVKQPIRKGHKKGTIETVQHPVGVTLVNNSTGAVVECTCTADLLNFFAG